MNIITVPYNSDFHYIRPDISLNRDSNDYFCPDDITEIAVVPFIYIRMERAGKAISAKFANRYCSQIGYGVSLSAKSLIVENRPGSFQTAKSLDTSTYISQLFQPEHYPSENILKGLEYMEQNIAGFQFDDENPWKDLLASDAGRIMQFFYEKIEKITKYTSVRTGDFIAMELHTPVIMPSEMAIKFGEISFSIK